MDYPLGEACPPHIGSSCIDHFAIRDGNGFEATRSTLYTGSFLELLSDDRSLLCWITGSAFTQLEPEAQKARDPPCTVRKHALKREDAKTVEEYNCDLRKLDTRDGLTPTRDPAQVASTLLRLPKNEPANSSSTPVICRLLVTTKMPIFIWSQKAITWSGSVERHSEVDKRIRASRCDNK